MAAPTFIAAYNSAYDTNTTPKTVSVTTQAGDVLVVYGGSENQSTLLDSPSGNGVTFNLQQSIIVTDYATAYVWTGVDTTGGTSWTLNGSTSTGTGSWGFTCVVFRGSVGVGSSSKANVGNAAPSLALTTLQNNSAIVVFSDDWNAVSGSSRTWLTVNSITPTTGNGLELTYYDGSAGPTHTAYGAYYNDAGTAGSKTVGLSAPGGQKYSIVAVEVVGTTAPLLMTSAVTNIAATTATGNGIVSSDGGDTITERGICWGTSANPTTANSKVTAAGTTGSYSGNITGLSDGTTYHVRAYAINGVGTSYGANVSFRNYGARGAWFTA